MSSSPSDHPTGRPTARARILELRRRIEAMREQSRSRRKRYRRAAAVLAAITVLYLSFVTSKILRVDAQALAEIGRVELERQLPDGVRNLREHLKTRAPYLITRVLYSCLDAVPQMRKAFADEVLERNTKILRQFEQEMIDLAHDVVLSGRTQLDRLDDGRSDVEKIEELVAFVAQRMRLELGSGLEALYPEYVAQLSRVHRFLERLRTTDESELTEIELVQKRLVQTVLELVVREGVPLDELLPGVDGR